MNSFIEAFTTPGNPSAFSGITNLKRELGGNLINKVLPQVDSYTIKREAKKPKKYNPYFIWDKRKHIQIDLIDFSSPKLKYLSRANSNYKYLFCAIDGFTKFAWVEPMKNKKDETCVNAFNVIIRQMGQKPKRVISDRGSEFISKKFLENLKNHNIKPIYANFKAGIVERFQRSLQSLYNKYMMHYKTKNFINVLPKILQTYNTRYHRTIRMSPQQAELEQNKTKVRKALKHYYNKTKEKKTKFHIGDKVRVQKQKGQFGRGYDNIFTNEIYNISSINNTLPVPMYSLTTFDGKVELLANFYENELQKVSGFPFKIVDILKTENMPQGVTRHYAEVNVNRTPYYAWINSKDLENAIAN